MASDQDIADALSNIEFFAELRATIPALVRMLSEVFAGTAPTITDPELMPLFNTLSGQPLTIADHTLTVGNVSGAGIAIGYGATSIVLRVALRAMTLPSTFYQHQADHRAANKQHMSALIVRPTGAMTCGKIRCSRSQSTGIGQPGSC